MDLLTSIKSSFLVKEGFASELKQQNLHLCTKLSKLSNLVEYALGAEFFNLLFCGRKNGKVEGYDCKNKKGLPVKKIINKEK